MINREHGNTQSTGAREHGSTGAHTGAREHGSTGVRGMQSTGARRAHDLADSGEDYLDSTIQCLLKTLHWRQIIHVTPFLS